MAARDGEEIVATLFGDIHYFYGGEDVKPRHHRFDKGSYVYLFENAHERRCRIEIANQAGTEDQDAFDGFLDQTHVRYSYKQHCMVSLTVAQNVPQDEWHLPTYDPRNENKYHYKLDSLDIYFWTDKDALQFVSGVRRVLPPAQVEVLDEPVVVQPAAVSAVVQNLENVAISDPQYAERQDSATLTQQSSVAVPSSASTALSMDNLPPPPPMPQYMQQQQQQKAATNFAPMAYNPAAPVAPETVTYREKTPPPDEDPLNPLAVAVAHDYQGQPFTPAFPHTQFPSGVASPGFAPSGMASPRMAPPSFGGPPQQPGIHRAQTMPVHAGLASPGLNGSFGSNIPGPPSFAPPPTAAQSPPAPAPAPAPTPAQVQAQAQAQPTPPAASAAASPPPLGGYSNYSYSNPTPAQNGGLDYSVHQQVYRPTEVEMSAKLQPYQPKKETKSKLEQKAGKLENGVTGMLKRFEKKFG